MVGWGPAALAVGLLLAGAGEVAAQTCRGGEEPVGWVGIGGLACNCTLTTGRVPVWSFRSEPRVLGVESGSQADGVLHTGDEIVAVNGDLITTSEAGRAFGALRPGVPLRLTVRRDGRTMDVTLTPSPICPGDPRAAPTTPRAIGETGQPTLPRRAPPAPQAVLPRTPLPPEAAPLSPPVPRLGRHGGWFGFGISCSQCSWDVETGDTVPRWRFTEYPRLFMVEEGSPAFAAGLRTGDQLLRIDGVGLRTEEGGRRFGAVRPGQRVRWTYRRGDREAVADVRAIERPRPPELARMADMLDTLAARTRRGERVPADFFRLWEGRPWEGQPAPGQILPRTPRPDAFRTVRFHDMIGGVEVEVLGGPGVVTTIVEEGRYVIIDTGEARIRVRVPDARDGRQRDR